MSVHYQICTDIFKFCLDICRFCSYCHCICSLTASSATRLLYAQMVYVLYRVCSWLGTSTPDYKHDCGLTHTSTNVNRDPPEALGAISCGCRQPQCSATALVYVWTLCLHKWWYAHVHSLQDASYSATQWFPLLPYPTRWLAHPITHYII